MAGELPIRILGLGSRHTLYWNIDAFYFKSNPEEMYLIQLNGVLLLADVFNENIVKGDWVATSERMPKNEEERVKKRFKEEVLDKIEAMARKNGVPDSILYFKPKW